MRTSSTDQKVLFAVQLIFDEEVLVLHRSPADDANGARTMVQLIAYLTRFVDVHDRFVALAAGTEGTLLAARAVLMERQGVELPFESQVVSFRRG